MYQHTNGITLSKVSEEDLTLLLALKKESWFGTHRVSIVNMEDQVRWLQGLTGSIHHPERLFLIAECDTLPPPEKEPIYGMPKWQDDNRVGTFKFTAVDWINRKADVGWDVFKKYRGHGLGRKIVEAGVAFSFDLLNLHRLDALILTDNHASIKCAEHAGFVREGVQRSAYYRMGKYLDSYYYGLVRD